MGSETKRTTLLFTGTVIALTLIGLIFIYSASSVFALEKWGAAHYFVKRQAGGVAVAFCCALLIARLPVALLAHLAPLLYGITLTLVALPFLVPSLATTIHGSARWLRIAGISLQPTELLKVAVVLLLAQLMSRRRFTQYSFMRSCVPIALFLLPALVLLLAQPDFGQTVLITATTCSMLIIAHPQVGALALTALIACGAALGLIAHKPYRLRRIMTFLYPWQDPQGAGFQIIQSLIAIGSGGIAGVGIAHSQQKFFYLPMQHTDFIFAIIAEETGFLGATLLIFLFGLLLYSGMRLAWHMRSLFSLLATAGYTSMITLQALINVAVATGLAPTKGIGLPFVSYGLSSLIAHGCMVGVILSCAREERR